MREIVHRPGAAAIVNSLRAIGYSFNTAIADILDNSLAAGSDCIDIRMLTQPSAYVAIIDNGVGMSEIKLLEAMRHGGAGPEHARAPEDLGRYGLGLKTASLSQCRRLTVVSMHNGQLSGARWDLDEIERRNEWILQLLPVEESATLPSVGTIRERGHGTLVLWERFDRALAGEALPNAALEKLVDASRGHLSLVFHRFLKSEDGFSAVSISINGLALSPIDPFMTDNKFTEQLPTEYIPINGQTVVVQPFILPHISNIKGTGSAENNRDGLKEGQGFYVYRNRRLITSGTWFRMIRQEELSKLARVKIDIPNSFDHLWGLDVKKSTATPPEEVRVRLKQIVDRIAQRSHGVFRDRRRRVGSTEMVRLWDRLIQRDGITYRINREHPSVAAMRESVDDEGAIQLEQLLRMTEVSLPIDSIYVDMTSDRSVGAGPEEIERDLSNQLALWLENTSGNATLRETLLQKLPQLDPFSMYPAITQKLLEVVRSAK